MKHAIYVEEAQGQNRSVILIEADDLRAALHAAADRLIQVYGGMPQNSGVPYGKREENWTGHSHPVLVVTAYGDDLERLTACTLWEELSD
jgi:hypothetical protein